MCNAAPLDFGAINAEHQVALVPSRDLQVPDDRPMPVTLDSELMLAEGDGHILLQPTHDTDLRTVDEDSRPREFLWQVDAEAKG
jgi:hypothetical protein